MSSTHDWKTLRERNQENTVAILSTLTAEEQLIFKEMISFEQQNRHINTPEYRRPIKKIIELSVRDSQSQGTQT
jgi:hypothetical protein